MHDVVGRAWASAHKEHGVECENLWPQNKKQNVQTYAQYRNCGSVPKAIAYTEAVWQAPHRQSEDVAGGVLIHWTGLDWTHA